MAFGFGDLIFRADMQDDRRIPLIEIPPGDFISVPDAFQQSFMCRRIYTHFSFSGFHHEYTSFPLKNKMGFSIPSFLSAIFSQKPLLPMAVMNSQSKSALKRKAGSGIFRSPQKRLTVRWCQPCSSQSPLFPWYPDWTGCYQSLRSSLCYRQYHICCLR